MALSHPLHPHPRKEGKLGLSNEYVIIDLEAFVKFTGLDYKGVLSVPGESAEDLIEHAIKWLKNPLSAASKKDMSVEAQYLQNGLDSLRERDNKANARDAEKARRK